MMKKFSIIGFWKFKSNRIRQEDGNWINEHLYGGAMAFSESNDALLFVRSDQGSWGYSGKFHFDGEHIEIKIEASIAEDIEGKVLQRTVKFVNENELKFSGIESHTGRIFETIFVRTNSL